MCGIAGIWGNVDDERLERMATALRHRGPDDEGTWTNHTGDLGLAHCRLAVIDPADGRQPMTNEDGRVVAVFNGVIYNYLELRETLISAGHTFRTSSDTETLVHLYEDRGPEMVHDLRGMFAFAIWDDRERTLLLARDRVGKKPLYYAETEGEFLFASEIKSLVTVLGSLELDQQAIADYLGWGCIPQPATVYRPIRSLMPGQLVVLRDRRIIRRSSYWAPSLLPKEKAGIADSVQRTERLLAESVRLRLRADVPVACFLSGGIDSGLLTAMASRICPNRLKTITVGFADAGFDERPLARTVAERFGTDHHEIVIEPNVAADLPMIAAAYDQPYADSSAIPSFYVARAAASLTKVVLTGDGGDELFAGYRRYVAAGFADKLSWLSSTIGGHGWESLRALLPTPGSFRTSYAFAHRFVGGMAMAEPARYMAWVTGGWDDESLVELGAVDWLRRAQPSDRIAEGVLAQFSGATQVDRMLATDLVTELPFDLLVKMDIACMAHGLEARSPLLDQELVDFALRLPSATKLSGLTTKPILRRLARKYLPPEVCRAPKRGFEVPLIRWLREDLRPLCRDVLLSRSGLLADMFDRSRLEDLLENRARLDPARWSRRLWILFMLGLWDQTVRSQ